jgi:hypothetical protein
MRGTLYGCCLQNNSGAGATFAAQVLEPNANPLLLTSFLVPSLRYVESVARGILEAISSFEAARTATIRSPDEEQMDSKLKHGSIDY